MGRLHRRLSKISPTTWAWFALFVISVVCGAIAGGIGRGRLPFVAAGAIGPMVLIGVAAAVYLWLVVWAIKWVISGSLLAAVAASFGAVGGFVYGLDHLELADQVADVYLESADSLEPAVYIYIWNFYFTLHVLCAFMLNHAIVLAFLAKLAETALRFFGKLVAALLMAGAKLFSLGRTLQLLNRCLGWLTKEADWRNVLWNLILTLVAGLILRSVQQLLFPESG